MPCPPAGKTGWHKRLRRGCPLPAVQYQVYFDYLSVLCGVMRERYKREYVFGRRTLKEDAEAEIVRSTAG